MTSRLLRLTSFLLIVILFLSACGPVTAVPTLEPSATRTPRATEPVIPATSTATRLPSINVSAESLVGARIQVWYALSGASEQAFLSLMARFNSVNEWGITVDAVSQGDYQTLGEAVGSSLIQASDQPASADLVIALPEQVLVWNASGVVVGLDPYIADSKWGLTENGGADDFVPTFWDQNRVNGRMLAVPAEYSGRYLFYNVTWAHELGFDHPPVTSDDFRGQACAANGSFRKDADPSDDGYGGWIVDTNWQTIYPLLLAYGQGMIDGDQYHFHTDANVAALTFLKNLKDDGCAWMAIDPENPSGLNTGPFYEQFARRSALFITGDLTEVPALNDTMARLNNSDEWTVTPFPGPDGGGVAVYGPSYTLLTSTPEKQLAAWLFVRWMLSAENQAKWVGKTGTLPLRISVLDQVADYRSTHPQWADAVNLLPFIIGVPQLASWGTLRYVLQDGTMDIFRMNLPPDQIPAVLEEMDATANELLNK
jgi:ABC-type glycerol-3-phosphate transport system substrate-binding protein